MDDHAYQARREVDAEVATPVQRAGQREPLVRQVAEEGWVDGPHIWADRGQHVLRLLLLLHQITLCGGVLAGRSLVRLHGRKICNYYRSTVDLAKCKTVL